MCLVESQPEDYDDTHTGASQDERAKGCSAIDHVSRKQGKQRVSPPRWSGAVFTGKFEPIWACRCPRPLQVGATSRRWLPQRESRSEMGKREIRKVQAISVSVLIYELFKG